MNKQFILGLLALTSTPFVLQAADEARLLRFPATNGSEIVFSYAGDLYKVAASGGEAKRLTSHVGYEMYPRFSPDGKTIAFKTVKNNIEIPVSWKKVAELSIDENLNAAGKTVSIYSIDEKGFLTLQENIRNFNWNKNVKVDIKSKP